VNSNNGHSHQSSNEVVLITGAGGSIGSALAKEIFAGAQQCGALASPNASPSVILFDNSEQNLYEIDSELSLTSATPPRHVSILCDTNDATLLVEIFEKYRPKIILHAAAFKHVPLMEENPIAVIRNNIIGTWTLASAAIKYKTRKLVMVSTDKAADPTSIMGATKRVAELILSSLDSPETRLRSVRLCNVLRSTGSVVPLFERQIRTGGPVTVTHPDATRYFISLQEATKLIFLAAALDDSGTLFVPELNAPVKIIDLANKMIAESSDASPKQIRTIVTGLRPGEKLEERLISSSETVEPTTEPKLRRVQSPIPSAETLRSAIALISKNLQSRDLPVLLDTIRALIPDYHPSEPLTALASSDFAPNKS
jgi:FlaA1/EpsC-like NDP-sugar epimerase